MLVDPVCGKRIKRQRAHIAIDYGGTTYYLCPRCQAEFEREPVKFARSEFGEKTKLSFAQGKTDRHDSESRKTMNFAQGIR